MKQHRGLGVILIAVGFLLALVGVAALVVSPRVHGLLFFAGLGVGYAGGRILNRGRRHFVRIGIDQLARDGRTPVLYLRPFHADGVEFQIDPACIGRGFADRGFWRQVGVLVRLIRTSEQLFARAFRDIGPLVAIGDPDEGLPRLGAVRVYARDGDEWKRVVVDLATRARYVILEIGLSDGVMWEVDFVTDAVEPEQLIISLPNDRTRRTRFISSGKLERYRQQQYAAFRQATEGEFPVPLPDEIGRAKLMYFDSDWTARPTYYEREVMFPFGRRIRHPEDPKREALIWCNSILF